MRFKNLLAGTLAACITLVSTNALAAFDAFLMIDGIKGESKDSRHKDELQIESFSFGTKTTATKAAGGGGGSGKAQFQDFHFVHRIDAASPKLFVACAAGEHIKKVKLTLRKEGGKGDVFMNVTLYDVLVTSVTPSGSADAMPMEQVSLNYAKIEFEYIKQGPSGKGESIKGGYDLKANKSV